MTRWNGCVGAAVLIAAALGCSGDSGTGTVTDAGASADLATGMDIAVSPVDAPTGADRVAQDSGPSDVACVGGATRCGDRCVSLDADNANCGACGTACAGGERCEAGRCVLTCPAGSAMCATDAGPARCADLQRDGEHCGACGAACPAGAVCAAGVCAASCGAGLRACGTSCRDVRNDPMHCGACGNACEAGQICNVGTCACPGSLQLCTVGGASRCVDTESDSTSCGTCGNACAAGTRCVRGRCEATCPAGQLACTTGCADVMSSIENCGGCGRTCPPTPNRPVVCREGVCGQGACNNGYADCDTDYANGCEVNLGSNPAHCGRCGWSCGSPRFGRAECTNGTCIPACDAGHGNCDGDPTNGCESDLQYDPRHCGGCGRACGAGQGCRRGTCVSTTGVLLCSAQAAIACLTLGGRTPSNGQDGRVVCVFGTTTTTDFCGQNCGSYRLFVWRDGAGLPACITQPAITRRGTSYTAPVTCGCDQPLRSCGAFDLGECVGD